MRLFTPLYDRAMAWAAHPLAPRYLAVLSFAESSFFPVPPDVMLAPMTAAEPAKGLWFALITTIASVIGGVFGYLIGLLAFDAIAPWLQSTSYWTDYLTAQEWFEDLSAGTIRSFEELARKFCQYFSGQRRIKENPEKLAHVHQAPNESFGSFLKHYRDQYFRC